MTESQERLTKETWQALSRPGGAWQENPEPDAVPAAYRNPDGWRAVAPPVSYPDLPYGWQLYSAQAPSLGWYYALTTPDGWQLHSHPRWTSPRAAAEAGLARAIELANIGLAAITMARRALEDGTVPVPDADLVTVTMEILAAADADRRIERLALAGGLIGLLIDRREAGLA